MVSRVQGSDRGLPSNAQEQQGATKKSVKKRRAWTRRGKGGQAVRFLGCGHQVNIEQPSKDASGVLPRAVAVVGRNTIGTCAGSAGEKKGVGTLCEEYCGVRAADEEFLKGLNRADRKQAAPA